MRRKVVYSIEPTPNGFQCTHFALVRILSFSSQSVRFRWFGQRWMSKLHSSATSPSYIKPFRCSRVYRCLPLKVTALLQRCINDWKCSIMFNKMWFSLCVYMRVRYNTENHNFDANCIMCRFHLFYLVNLACLKSTMSSKTFKCGAIFL